MQKAERHDALLLKFESCRQLYDLEFRYSIPHCVYDYLAHHCMLAILAPWEPNPALCGDAEFIPTRME